MIGSHYKEVYKDDGHVEHGALFIVGGECLKFKLSDDFHSLDICSDATRGDLKSPRSPLRNQP